MSEPQKYLILHDADGQPWAISVRSDGQLQTEKWPQKDDSGEPMATNDYAAQMLSEVLERYPA